MAELKDLINLPHWSRLLLGTGALIAIGSVPMGRPLGYFLIGLGLLFLGIGETVNRPETKEKETREGMLGFRMVTAHNWTPTTLGVIADIAGLGLLLFGLYQVVVAP